MQEAHSGNLNISEKGSHLIKDLCSHLLKAVRKKTVLLKEKDGVSGQVLWEGDSETDLCVVCLLDNVFSITPFGGREGKMRPFVMQALSALHGALKLGWPSGVVQAGEKSAFVTLPSLQRTPDRGTCPWRVGMTLGKRVSPRVDCPMKTSREHSQQSK